MLSSRKFKALLVYVVFVIASAIAEQYLEIPNLDAIIQAVGAVVSVYMLSVAIEDYATKKDQWMLKAVLSGKIGSLPAPVRELLESLIAEEE